MTVFTFDDFASTTLGGARNVADGKPLTPAQVDRIINYLKSPGSGPDSVTSYAEYLDKQMQTHAPSLPNNKGYVGFSGMDSANNSNFDNAKLYVSDVGNKAGIIGDTPWGNYIEDLELRPGYHPDFVAIEQKFVQFMRSEGVTPYKGDYPGALRDMMWNAGSPKFFENAIATERPFVAFVENAQPGRGFSNFELPTALQHPNAIINGYPVSVFGPDPLGFASRSAAEFQQLEKTIADAATVNTGRTVLIEEVRSKLNLIEGYNAVDKTVFNQPVDAFKSLSIDEMAATRSAWTASPARMAPGLHARTIGDTPHGTPAEPGAPRGPPSQAAHVEGTAAAESISPPRQRGFASMELLTGEVPRNTLIRSGGLLATGIDLGVSAQRAAELLGQDNPRAAQSEVDHALARNLGGWVGGTSTAAVIGTSGYLPAALVVADAVLISKGFDKAVELKENREIYHQTDQHGVAWEFNGYSWTKEGLIDSTMDGVDNPVASRIGASYEESRELGARANVVAVEMALGKLPAPRDPFDIPARASDQLGINNPNWTRNPDTEQWQRVVKTGVTGVNDRGIYEVQTAGPERAAELNQEALGRIAQNIASGREAMAVTYLENHVARRSGDFIEVPAAVQAALPKPDLVTASNRQTYHREADGTWTSLGNVAQGNLALELELTRMARQPSIEQHTQRLASLEAQPAPTHEQMTRNHFLHRYDRHGIHLSPEWQEAIELATQRTRDEHGLTSVVLEGLQPKPAEERFDGKPYTVDSPIAHYELGADGAPRIVAITSSEEIVQAWREVQARSQQQRPESEVPEPHESPEQRTAAAAPQQREVREQTMHDAQRSGLSQNEVERVATLAAVSVSAPRADPTHAGHGEADVRTEREKAVLPPAAASHAREPAPETETRRHDAASVSAPQVSATPARQWPSYQPPTDLRHPDHPGHYSYQRALEETHRMESSQGITSGPHSEKIAAATAVTMLEQKMPSLSRMERGEGNQIHGIQQNPERRIAIDTDAALSKTVEQHSQQWLAARSPHYVSHAPAAQRTREDEETLERLSPQNQAMFCRAREGAPPQFSDAMVVQGVLAAQREGIDTADKINSVSVLNNQLLIQGKTPGYRAMVDVTESMPSLQESVAQVASLDRQREQERQQEQERQLAQQKDQNDPARGGLKMV